MIQRAAAVQAILAWLNDDDIVVSTTGLISRQLFRSGDRPRNFYMLGSMGLASSLALGLATLRPAHRVVVLEGDGSALMSLGTMPLIATEAPSNLVHIILDNGAYESTGAQTTIATAVSLADIARASGYATALEVTNGAALSTALASLSNGPALIVAKVALEAAAPPPRVTLTPAQVRDRLVANLTQELPK